MASQPVAPQPSAPASKNPVVEIADSVKNAVEKVIHFVHQASVYVNDAFVEIFGKARAQAFGHAAVAILQSEAGKIALDAVAVAESVQPALGGAAKRAQAFTKIENDLKVAKHDVPASLINLLIELAVQAIQGGIVIP